MPFAPHVANLPLHYHAATHGSSSPTVCLDCDGENGVLARSAGPGHLQLRLCRLSKRFNLFDLGLLFFFVQPCMWSTSVTIHSLRACRKTLPKGSGNLYSTVLNTDVVLSKAKLHVVIDDIAHVIKSSMSLA